MRTWTMYRGGGNAEKADFDFDFTGMLADGEAMTVAVTIAPTGQLALVGSPVISAQVVKVILSATSAVDGTTYNVDVWATGGTSGLVRKLEANIQVLAT